jgi:2-aminoadipate transaminase
LSIEMKQGPPILQFEERPGILDLGWGHPRASLLPVEEWAAAAAEASRSFGWQALTYGYAAGPGPLIEWLAGHLAQVEGSATDPSRFFITGGASHALSLVSTVLAQPGDTILVDSPTYHFGLRILRDRGVRIVKAPTDSEGIDPAALGVMLSSLRNQGRRVALLYIVPTFCNPTGRSLPRQRRDDLVKLALRTGLTIVEDDTYRELVYAGTAPASLWQLAGGTAVVRIGSFSKTVGPGLRLGWINADTSTVRKLMSLGYIDSGGGVNHATGLAMATFGASGAYQRQVARMRAACERRRDTLTRALRSGPHGLTVPSPAGGWFLWLPLPHGMTADALLPAAERHGVSFVAGTEFYPDGEDGEQFVRLCFSFLTEPELTEAARRLASAIMTMGRPWTLPRSSSTGPRSAGRCCCGENRWTWPTPSGAASGSRRRKRRRRTWPCGTGSTASIRPISMPRLPAFRWSRPR